MPVFNLGHAYDPLYVNSLQSVCWMCWILPLLLLKLSLCVISISNHQSAYFLRQKSKGNNPERTESKYKEEVDIVASLNARTCKQADVCAQSWEMLMITSVCTLLNHWVPARWMCLVLPNRTCPIMVWAEEDHVTTSSAEAE